MPPNLFPKKVAILSLPMILAVFLLGGWFLFRDQKASEESPKSPVVEENSTQNSGNNREPSENIDTSNWKTYRNEEYGFEVKYPEKIFYLTETSDSDGGIYIRIGEKGRSIDDINSTIVFAFNQLKSEKFYDVKKNGKCVKVSIVGRKNGIICGYEELANAQKSDYDLFLSKASCNGFFEIWFDEEKRPFGDVFNYVKFGCTKEPSLKRVYKAIYDSMVFFSPQSSN